MPCSKNMCGKAEATAGDDPECEAAGTQRGEAWNPAEADGVLQETNLVLWEQAAEFDS